MKTFPLKALIPFAATAGNLVVGLLSIVLAASGRFEGAAWCIVYSAILDKADGTLARALRVEGSFGMEMDSFADYTSFGIAPGTLAWFLAAAHLEGFALVWVALGSLAMPLAAATRLARFNAVTHEDHYFFEGVPTTLIGGILATFLLSLLDLGVAPGIAAQWMAPACLAGAWLMVGRIRIPKIQRHGRRWKDIGQWVVIGGLTILAVFQKAPEAHFLLGSAYVALSFLRHGRFRKEASGASGTGGGVR
mgnify:CR=1 FL=1